MSGYKPEGKTPPGLSIDGEGTREGRQTGVPRGGPIVNSCPRLGRTLSRGKSVAPAVLDGCAAGEPSGKRVPLAGNGGESMGDVNPAPAGRGVAIGLRGDQARPGVFDYPSGVFVVILMSSTLHLPVTALQPGCRFSPPKTSA